MLSFRRGKFRNLINVNDENKIQIVIIMEDNLPNNSSLKREEIAAIIDDIRRCIEDEIKRHETILPKCTTILSKGFYEGSIAGMRHVITLLPLPETINIKCEDC